METKIAKVLDNGRRVSVNLKRKRSANCDMYLISGARKLLSKRTTLYSSISKVAKRRKLDGSRKRSGCCASQFKTSLLTGYSNFARSGIPQRLMVYQNGEWNDFPFDLVTLIKKDLQVKKAATDVEYNGHNYVLDFLHMVRLETKTGSQQPMAWIDESGKCFFPETFSGEDEHQECCVRNFAKGHEDLGLAPAYQDIRLQLEIEVKESDSSKFGDCSGDSSAFVKQIHVDEKFTSGHDDLEVQDSCAKPFDVGESKQKEKNGVLGIEYGHLDSDDVKKLFLMGMGSSASADDVELYRGSSSSMEARLELFYKQIEITTKFRGDANVHYAWFPTTKEAQPNIMMYGLGYVEASETKSTYGVGLYLSPANCTFNSARCCDVDENGVRHMVFCRVLMGNMELVHKGSKQFHPSGIDFDSGVDDLQNPNHYIVWNMNKNTHIYPEYAVSFKVSSDATGFIAKNVSKLDNSGVTACSAEPPVRSELHTSPAQLVPVEKVPSLGLSTIRSPKSPYIAFPILLAAMSSKVPPELMKMLESEYELLRSKTISRQDFIRKLRLTVGDALLRSEIMNLHSKEKANGGQLIGKVDIAADQEEAVNGSKEFVGQVAVVGKVMTEVGGKPIV